MCFRNYVQNDVIVGGKKERENVCGKGSGYSLKVRQIFTTSCSLNTVYTQGNGRNYEYSAW